MDIIEEKSNDIAVFKLNGSLDSNTSPAFEEKVVAIIEGGTSKIIVDFSGLDYISSAGLRVLNLASVKLKPSNGNLVLCCLQDYVREVFEIAGFDQFLPIVATMEDATAKFN
ncbi:MULTISPECIES: STAS domain-containing protein [Desulfatibacillum]|jgi:anti-sigma B factor antagonist|uniref:Anti-sigma factor antagonist n=2 Tax=Desulfatibacillum TaxID=218207 RepID=B8FK77_DESAL|nr:MULTISPECIES: STAS domain-containing protein [Desulfatibacillum]ACL02752.1 anti-sigma-factor antagonist [Desulfatibacillum aliphaticivorans]SHJ20194.1 anti-sigma B factor antagonist [Desulfatibacillum alkenivorans DSM 16219]